VIVHRFPADGRRNDYARVDLDVSPGVACLMYRWWRETSLSPFLARLATIGMYCDSEHGRMPST
jgi:hypothetical protein